MSKRTGIMLCYPFEEKRIEKWGYPVIVQPKLDGVRCRAVVKNNKVTLLSSEENEIVSVPHVNDWLKRTVNNIELDGELYVHGMSFEDIVSITSRTKNLHPDYLSMQYHLFDIVSEDKEQYVRLDYLNKFRDSLIIRVVEWYAVEHFEGLMNLYNEILNQNYEGIIVRHPTALYTRKRSTYMMKFKPKKDDWYNVVGYKEEISKDGIPKGRLGAVECTGDDGHRFTVGSGFTDADRIKYWEQREELTGMICHVQYQHITPGKGVPRFPVFVELYKTKI